MHNGFYYDGQYFLMPKSQPDADKLLARLAIADMPCTILAIPVFEDNQEFIRRCKPWNGISMVPFFLADYLVGEVEVTIENAAEVFPVSLTLLSQKEYNARLRELVVDYCPGCTNFGGVTRADSSLEGHHTEISLDGVCLYRRTPDSPDYDFLSRIPAQWPAALLSGDADAILAFFFKQLGLHYETGLLRIHEDGSRELLVRQCSPDIFLTGLTGVLNVLLLRDLGGRFTLRLTNPAPTDEATLLSLIDHGQDVLRLAPKTRSVALGYIEVLPGRTGPVARCLEPAEALGYLHTLCTTDSRIYLLFTEPVECQVYLRYHNPALASCEPRITVFTPDGPETRRISFQMEKM